MYYKSFQTHSVRKRSRNSATRPIVISILLLNFLVVAALLYWLALPAWQVRLSGVQTTAIAHVDSACGNGDDSPDYAFSYTYTGPQEKSYRVAHDNFCTNVISNGDQVTVWYMPDNPTNLLTSPEAILLYVFSAMGGALGLGLLIASIAMLVQGFRVRRAREAYDYTAADYQNHA